MNRAFHYAEAERLAEQARERIDASEKHAGLRRAARDDAHLFLRAALIHATLAAAGPGVEDGAIAPARPKPGPPPGARS